MRVEVKESRRVGGGAGICSLPEMSKMGGSNNPELKKHLLHQVFNSQNNDKYLYWTLTKVYEVARHSSVMESMGT